MYCSEDVKEEKTESDIKDRINNKNKNGKKQPNTPNTPKSKSKSKSKSKKKKGHHANQQSFFESQMLNDAVALSLDPVSNVSDISDTVELSESHTKKQAGFYLPRISENNAENHEFDDDIDMDMDMDMVSDLDIGFAVRVTSIKTPGSFELNDDDMEYIDYDSAPNNDEDIKQFEIEKMRKSITKSTLKHGEDSMNMIFELADDLDEEDRKAEQPGWKDDITGFGNGTYGQFGQGPNNMATTRETFGENGSEIIYGRNRKVASFTDMTGHAIIDIAETDGNRKEIPLPYTPTCWGRIHYEGESFLVKHPRIYAIYLLILSILPRGLVMFDMYTDGLIAIELYKGSERIWFMISCLFIAFPFVLVWSASLRFIQNYLQKLPQESKILNFCLLIYMFPPVGAVVTVLVEIYWVLRDIFIGVKSFVLGTGLINSADREEIAMTSLSLSSVVIDL